MKNEYFLNLDVDQPTNSVKGVPLGAIKQVQDGAIEIPSSANHIESINYDFETDFANEAELIRKYDEMSLEPYICDAVDEILNDFVVTDDENLIKLDLSSIEDKHITDSIKEKLNEQFKYITNLLNFDKEGFDIVKDWYYKGKQYHFIQLTNDRKSIKNIFRLDQENVKKIREKKTTNKQNTDKESVEVISDTNDFYLYKIKDYKDKNRYHNLMVTNENAVKFPHTSIIQIDSGIYDKENNLILSEIHSAIRTYNQLKQTEDAMVIWRLVRAPQKRVFYIDVGNSTQSTADTFITQLAAKFKSKLQYNAQTGNINTGQKGIQSIYEDYFIPRKNDKTTEIDTLSNDDSGGDLEGLEYLQKKLYKSLKIPRTRIDPEVTYSLGRAAEITRDEMKFHKYIQRLRNRFSNLFIELLQRQLELQGIMKEHEFREIQNKINFIWAKDNYYEELKNSEILSERIRLVGEVNEYVPQYFDEKYVHLNVLNRTEDEYEEFIANRPEEGNEETEEDEGESRSSLPKQDG